MMSTQDRLQSSDKVAGHFIRYAMPFEELKRSDVALVGGKNASLGELIADLSAEGVRVPTGFATTSDAYRVFVDNNGLDDVIHECMKRLENQQITLNTAGQQIRDAFLAAEWPSEVRDCICHFYAELSGRLNRTNPDVAVRSSATAEDLPDASFAGQQETYLNVCGEGELLAACRRCYASLFTDRAIAYRQAKGYDHREIALSVGVQVMVRADSGASGVMFSIDIESGFGDVAVINAAWGLGETVVQGTVDPDEIMVYKPFLDESSLTPIIKKELGQKACKMVYGSDDSPTYIVPTALIEREAFAIDDQEALALARWAQSIERHYGCPMDIEWARDGHDGDLYVVQARPETVQSRTDSHYLKSYAIQPTVDPIVRGISVGSAIVDAPVCLVSDPQEREHFIDGSILVASNTDPDWVPLMKRASGIITDHGGRTSHAAIVSRELGVPAVIGSGDATRVLHDSQHVTLSCAQGDVGMIYAGKLPYFVDEIELDKVPGTQTRVMLNLADPGAAFRWWNLPTDGVGLARMEFVINNHVKVHPMALVRYADIRDDDIRMAISALTAGYEDKRQYFVDTLAVGLSRIAASCYPRPVIVRMSDFKTNEYANLLGGQQFEPEESNPMLGFRGARRYYSPEYRDGFALECQAIAQLRGSMGFRNVIIMIPFCRSLQEADDVLEIMADNGLVRGQDGLQVYVMCEIPANVILAKQFADRFDGFSIGSNDLTQLTLGVDRDSDQLTNLFDEQNEAVKWMISHVIQQAHESGVKVGLCGQAPSDHPEFARFLVECGIDSISVSPDSFISVKQHVAEAERKLGKRP